MVVLTHRGDEGEVLVVVLADRPGEQEVDVAVVFEGEAEVVVVALDEGVGLDRRGLDDAVEHHPLLLRDRLQDAGGDKLGAVMAAVPFSNLMQRI